MVVLLDVLATGSMVNLKAMTKILPLPNKKLWDPKEAADDCDLQLF